MELGSFFHKPLAPRGILETKITPRENWVFEKAQNFIAPGENFRDKNSPFSIFLRKGKRA